MKFRKLDLGHALRDLVDRRSEDDRVADVIRSVPPHFAFQAGFNKKVTWTPAGGGLVTFNVTEHSWQEKIDKLDVTHSGSAGIQYLLAGILARRGLVQGQFRRRTGRDRGRRKHNRRRQGSHELLPLCTRCQPVCGALHDYDGAVQVRHDGPVHLRSYRRARRPVRHVYAAELICRPDSGHLFSTAPDCSQGWPGAMFLVRGLANALTANALTDSKSGPVPSCLGGHTE